MPKPRPEPRRASDEHKRLMFLTWGELIRSGRFEDIDRAARLHGLVNDPYHELAFGDLSREDKMEICAHGLMENGEWQAAYRVLARLDRIDHEKARLARQAQRDALCRLDPDPEPEAAPEPPEPEPEPEPAPPPMLFGRRWSRAQWDELVANHPDLADKPPAEIRRIVASFPPAPDT